MKVFRASLKGRAKFDPLDSSGSVMRGGWRFNDKTTEILYAAEVQSLALLEAIVRPGWNAVDQVTVATIEVPDGSIVSLSELQITLPTNWNARPASRDSRQVAAQFLTAARAARDKMIRGVRVPSVIATTDSNVLLDPMRKSEYIIVDWTVVPFLTLRSTPS